MKIKSRKCLLGKYRYKWSQFMLLTYIKKSYTIYYLNDTPNHIINFDYANVIIEGMCVKFYSSQSMTLQQAIPTNMSSLADLW